MSAYEHLPADPGGTDPPGQTLFGLGKLQSAARSAFAVAQWLESSYSNPAAPLGTIRLLLSPSAAELADQDIAAAAAAVSHARAADVEKAIDDWYADCATDDDNIAFFYAAGHGIELAKDQGGIVLLEDFAGKPPKVLANALDTENLRAGMAGATMARTQFYFVDACRVQPALAAQVALEAGIRIDVPQGAGLGPTSSPMYFSASSGTLALGEPGKGTLFSQALIECLDLLALAADDSTGQWQVTDTSLVGPLKQRVLELAAKYGEEQHTTTGGQFADRALHSPAQAPSVPLEIYVDPDAASEYAYASVGPDLSQLVVVDHPLHPPAAIDVPLGLYVVTVAIRPPTDPFRDGGPVPCLAFPPRPQPVRVPV